MEDDYRYLDRKKDRRREKKRKNQERLKNFEVNEDSLDSESYAHLGYARVSTNLGKY